MILFYHNGRPTAGFSYIEQTQENLGRNGVVPSCCARQQQARTVEGLSRLDKGEKLSRAQGTLLEVSGLDAHQTYTRGRTLLLGLGALALLLGGSIAGWSTRTLAQIFADVSR